MAIDPREADLWGDEEQREHTKMVQAILELEEGLSEWEIDFAESLNAQTVAGRRLTEKQVQVLRRIYEEKA